MSLWYMQCCRREWAGFKARLYIYPDMGDLNLIQQASPVFQLPSAIVFANNAFDGCTILVVDVIGGFHIYAMFCHHTLIFHSLANCTCGPSCQCPDDCKGSCCPCVAGGQCTCGDSCNCGDACTCREGTCPSKKQPVHRLQTTGEHMTRLDDTVVYYPSY